MSAITNVRTIKRLKFSDGSVYRGQVLGNGVDNAIVPYGYGCLTTQTGFTVYGYFINGKNNGSGIFIANNGDVWYGQWNAHNRRHGSSIFVRHIDRAVISELYNDGVREKHIRKLPCKIGTLHWSTDIQCISTIDAPVNRSGHTCVNVNNQYLILYGGLHDTFDIFDETQQTTANSMQCLNDIWQYNIHTTKWHQLCTDTTLPYLSGHTCTQVGNVLLFIGGIVNNDVVVMNSDIYKFDLQTQQFTTLVSKTLPFNNHCTVYCANVNRLFIFVNSTVFEFDLHTLQYTEFRTDYTAIQRARQPIGLLNATATYIQQLNSIVVIGGKIIDTHSDSDKIYDKCNNTVRMLNINTLTWSVPTITKPTVTQSQSTKGDYSGITQICNGGHIGRSEHTATLLQDRYIYVYGGLSTLNPQYNIVDTCYLSDTQILDVVEMCWLDVQCETLIQPLPRAQHTTTLINSELYVFGGKNFACESISGWSKLYTLSSTVTDKPVTAAPKIKPVHTDKTVVKPVATAKATVTERRKVILPDRTQHIDTTESKQQCEDEVEYVEPVVETQPAVGSGSILNMFKANMNI